MAAATNTSSSQFDVVFEGTWIFVPSVDSSGNIIGVWMCTHRRAAIPMPRCSFPNSAPSRRKTSPRSRASTCSTITA